MTARAAERGSVMVVAMISLVGLLSLGGVTVLTIASSASAAASERFKTVSLYAAESGIAAGTAYLRTKYINGTYWTELVSPSNSNPESPHEIPGNAITSDVGGAMLSEDTDAWYLVTILNNESDPGFAAGTDSDGRVILRSVGHGPNGAVSILEVEMVPNGVGLGGEDGGATRPCPGYGQRGMSGDNAGRNDCLGTVDKTVVKTFFPAGS